MFPTIKMTKPPVSRSNWLHRLGVASLTLVVLSIATLLKDNYFPSTARAAVVKETSISTHSVQKSCISSTNATALNHPTSNYLSTSLLQDRVSERAAFKIVEHIRPIVPFVSMERQELPKRAFARKVDKTPLEKQNCLYRSTRKVFVRPPQGFPGLGEFVQIYDSYTKQEEKEMEKVDTFVKDNKIVDPRRIELVKKTSAKLKNHNLCLSKREDVVLFALEMTSQSCSNLASTPEFTDEDKDLFLQETGVAVFVLEAGFPPKNLNVKNIIKQNIAKLGGSTVFANDPETWQNFQYKAMGVLASDLGVDLTQLRWNLGTRREYFTPVVQVSSLTRNYFKMQVEKLDNIVRRGWEEQMCPNKGQEVAFTNTVIRVDDLRGESLFSFYDKTYKTCFEDNLFSATGNKLSNIRDRRCISEIIDVSQLNPDVLFEHHFRLNARPHFKKWQKSVNPDHIDKLP